MPSPLRVLILEDNPSDAELVLHELRGAGFDPDWQRVETMQGYVAELDPSLDVILADYTLPGFRALEALEMLRERGLDIPFIVVTGTVSEEVAVECMKQGATDYLLKDRLSRLGQAVRHALDEKRSRQDRQRAQRALQESEARFRRLAENAQDVIYRYRLSPPRGFEYVSPAATAITGYTPEEHYLDPELGFRMVHPEDQPLFQAMLDARAPFEAPLILRWRRRDGVMIWTEQRNVPIYDEASNLVAIEGIARDITERKQSEEALHEALEKLRRVFQGTIDAVASILETRDPYTAGHSRRVGWLAAAIAKEMGLSDEEIEAIHIAGILHDIGKVHVPAEILSKPSALNEHEFGIIKAHPQVGYEILQNIEFPWPVAQIVQQHHERLDGSGYPLGLSGESFLLAARVLAVADVVEAMSSHRPYRAALGIDKAIEEISIYRGKLYDHRGVDACIQLFRESGFTF